LKAKSATKNHYLPVLGHDKSNRRRARQRELKRQTHLFPDDSKVSLEAIEYFFSQRAPFH